MDNNQIIDMPEDNGFEVYVKVNADGYIIEVGSNVFIRDYIGWILIDKNVKGDRGAHAQTQYFDKPLMNDDGTYNYKYEDGKIIGG